MSVLISSLVFSKKHLSKCYLRLLQRAGYEQRCFAWTKVKRLLSSQGVTRGWIQKLESVRRCSYTPLLTDGFPAFWPGLCPCKACIDPGCIFFSTDRKLNYPKNLRFIVFIWSGIIKALLLKCFLSPKKQRLAKVILRFISALMSLCDVVVEPKYIHSLWLLKNKID